MRIKEKEKIKSLIITIVIFCMLLIIPAVFLSGCSIDGSNNQVYVLGIEKTDSSGLVDTYTISYSDGSKSTFTITNGSNGNNGSDGKDLTINEVYEKYVEEYGDISYSDFLKEYLSLNSTDNSKVINKCLQSCMKVYTEFDISETYYYGMKLQTVKSVSVMCGSAVIYKMASDYTYVLTNYHVVYSASANADNGSNIAKKITGYLYGSEGSPVDSGTSDNGYTVYDYGDYGISLEYIGGSIDYDIAVLRVETSNILNINERATAVTTAENYHVGETAIAVGNPENEGISVTQGVVSVDNEYITLAIDNTSRSYRSIRIDTSIYGGSSGGGLFNVYGQLIGITNAGDKTDENINYAIPLEIVTSVVNNILDYYNGQDIASLKKITLGVTVNGTNSKYVFDENTSYGQIVETINITSVSENSIAESIGLVDNDIISSIVINGTEYNLNRYFELGDVLLNIRANDIISIKYKRGDQFQVTTDYTVQAGDLK